MLQGFNLSYILVYVTEQILFQNDKIFENIYKYKEALHSIVY